MLDFLTIKPAKASLILLFCFFCASCSHGPQISPFPYVLSRSEVAVLKQAIRKKVERRYSLLQDKQVGRYVNTIGQSIIARNPQMPPLPYIFKVLQDRSFHIFSLPGGVVYITTGAIRAFTSEGILAAALAHELAHQEKGHFLLVWKQRVEKGASPEKITASLLAHVQPNLFQKDGLFYYGNALEKEADEKTLTLLYQAGFDPRFFLSYLNLLDRLSAKKKQQLYLQSSLHPPTKDRLSWTQKFSRTFLPKKYKKRSYATLKDIQRRLKKSRKP